MAAWLISRWPNPESERGSCLTALSQDSFKGVIRSRYEMFLRLRNFCCPCVAPNRCRDCQLPGPHTIPGPIWRPMTAVERCALQLTTNRFWEVVGGSSARTLGALHAKAGKNCPRRSSCESTVCLISCRFAQRCVAVSLSASRNALRWSHRLY
jgi:hypothetical protein